VLCKLLGRAGTHEPGNPLGTLAIESTFWLLAGIAVAYGMHVLRLEWFFPAMLLVIGGRYLTFQSLYGLRIYWLLGATLCAAGVALALARLPASVSALSGAAIELVFAALVFAQANVALRPNSSPKRSANDGPSGPRGSQVHPPTRGPGVQSSPAELER
jgi:hypothetical protein